MNQLDLACVAVIAISALLGLSRGFVREVLGLGAWAVAAWVSYSFGPGLVPAARHALGNDELFASIAAYAVVFIAALIACSVLANLVGRLVRLSLLGGLDRSLGMLFGAGRGAALLIAGYVLAGMAVPAEQWPLWVRQARSLPALHAGADGLTALLPPRLRPAVAAPPALREATADALLHASPSGSALQAAPAKPK